MSRVTVSSLSGTFFTSALPDVSVPVSGTAVKARIRISIDSSVVYDEKLWPVDGIITLTDLGELVEPLAQKRLVVSMAVSAQPLDAGDEEVGSPLSGSATVLFSRADVGVSASEFYSGHFLSILMGTKVTAAGRRELLWYYGNGAASATAEYADGTTAAFTPSAVGGTSAYTCIDVSPGNFVTSGKQLVAYTVTAGTRSQRFEMDLSAPDCAPILEFYNSFGVWEYIYCTGTHQVSPDYKRSQARIGGMLRNYRIEETRLFKADTGILNTAMANWADDLFRSDEVYVVNVVNGSVASADGGKEVVINDSKSEVSNDADHMPRFTFSYQYAQRIQNVLQLNRVGRIFDNTFDHTFN